MRSYDTAYRAVYLRPFRERAIAECGVKGLSSSMAVWQIGVIVLLVLAVQGNEECVLERGNPCRCKTRSGHLQLDISFLFSYP